MIEDAALLELAAELADKAGAEIRAIRARGFTVERKADQSAVTEADRASEAIILAGLRGALPDCAVIAEEEVASGAVAVAASSFWLVDPLDGTREFSSGGNDFAVNIGFVRDGRPVLGVVGVPATSVIYGGIVGTGAWRQSEGRRTRIVTRQPPPDGLTVVAMMAAGRLPGWASRGPAREFRLKPEILPSGGRSG